jgi:hypothetical protein
MGGAIYIHETMGISIEKRRRYLEHFCSWGPLGEAAFGMPCFGVWATVGSTGAVPEAICMWELEDIEALGRMLSGEFKYLVEDEADIGDHYDKFWATAPDLKESPGFDRLLMATPRTPTIAEAINLGIRGAGYYHETITVPPGQASAFLERYEEEYVPIAEEHGWVWVGAYRTTMRNDTEAIVLWALPKWSAFVQLERGLRTHTRAVAWRRWAARVGATWEGKLLAPAEASPLVTGKLLK